MCFVDGYEGAVGASSLDDFVGTLNELLSRVHKRLGGLPGGRLPHHLAVCVTKFDDSRVFEKARQQRWVSQANPSALPLPADPKAYFASISGRVADAIGNAFDPARTAYFVTSAVGFRRALDDTVDLRDYSNVRIVDGGPRIIGEVRPMNVLEPLIWLERSIRRQGPPRGNRP